MKLAQRRRHRRTPAPLPRREPPRGALLGASLLLSYVEDQGDTLHGFARDAGLDPGELRKLVGGRRQRVSVATAAKIEDASNGLVPWRSWIPRSEARQ